MNVVNFNERACERYRRYFDAYLDNELLVETNQDVLQHHSCAECARILEGRGWTTIWCKRFRINFGTAPLTPKSE